jgi:hypothetical protein
LLLPFSDVGPIVSKILEEMPVLIPFITLVDTLVGFENVALAGHIDICESWGKNRDYFGDQIGFINMLKHFTLE